MNKSHEKAVRLLWEGRSEEAVALLESLPSSPDVLNDRAVALYMSGRGEEALELVGKALEADPTHGAAILNAKYMRAAIEAALCPSKHKVLEDRGPPPGPEPAVSVIMPTYNRVDFIEEAIGSVLAQTRSDFEIVVVNDGGTRDCEEIIKRVGADRVRYIYIEHAGLSTALNAGIAHSRGRYIAYLDDDDVYYPDHIEALADYLDERPEAKVAYSHAKRATQVKEGRSWRVARRDVVNREPFDRKRLLRSNRLAVLNVMHRRELVDEIGGFNEALDAGMDWEMWIRMSASHEFHRIDRMTSEYRVRSNASQMTAHVLKMRASDNTVAFLHRLLPLTSRMPEIPGYSFALKFFGRLAKKYPETIKAVDLRYLTDKPQKAYPLFYTMGKALAGMGRHEAAAASFMAAVRVAPWEPKLYFAWAKTVIKGSGR